MGYKDGVLRWTYPNGWPSLHWGHRAPPVQYPGMLIATTKPVGYPVTPRGTEGVQMWGYNGDPGQIYLLSTDGLFVTMLFRDGKGAKFPVWGTLPEAKRGMSLNDIIVPGENFWPRLVQTRDGNVYVITGKNHSSIVRVDGLETARRITGNDITVTPALLQQVTAYFVRQDAARQAGAGTRTLQVALRAAAPKVDGKLDDWAKAAWVTLDDTTQAAVSIAGDRLYAAYRTQDRNLLANTGEVPTALFKCGGALDLMLGTDSKADGKRGTPVAGDLRLLVTQVRGKTAAVLYRPVVPGTREPVPFSSPWRTITIDRVDDVSAQVALAGGKRREEVVKRGKVAAVLNWEEYEFSVPLAALGLVPQAGRGLTGDIGIIRGSAGDTAQRLYWHNKSTGIVNDVPGEALLTPQLWGRWEFVAE
jgi:hypothetical protein